MVPCAGIIRMSVRNSLEVLDSLVVLKTVEMVVPAPCDGVLRRQLALGCAADEAENKSENKKCKATRSRAAGLITCHGQVYAVYLIFLLDASRRAKANMHSGLSSKDKCNLSAKSSSGTSWSVLRDYPAR